MLSPDYHFKSFMPPTIVKIDNITYVCPGWHIVPEGTTLDDVYAHWTQELPANATKPTGIIINEEVLSSKGDKKYKVAYDGMWWNCECPGFGFRKKCAHVDQVKKQYNMT